jgi:antitoxin ParD1/3/4
MCVDALMVIRPCPIAEPMSRPIECGMYPSSIFGASRPVKWLALELRDNYYQCGRGSVIYMPRSFALGEHFEEFIDAQVIGGRYNNASEVVRDALRLLEDRERQRQLEVRGLLEQGRASGLSDRPGEAVLDRLEAKYRGMAKRRRA